MLRKDIIRKMIEDQWQITKTIWNNKGIRRDWGDSMKVKIKEEKETKPKGFEWDERCECSLYNCNRRR